MTTRFHPRTVATSEPDDRCAATQEPRPQNRDLGHPALRWLEVAGEGGDYGVVGESGIAVGVVGVIRDAGLAVALHGPGAVNAQHVATVRIDQAGLDGDDVAGAAEAVAGAEGIPH